MRGTPANRAPRARTRRLPRIGTEAVSKIEPEVKVIVRIPCAAEEKSAREKVPEKKWVGLLLLFPPPKIRSIVRPYISIGAVDVRGRRTRGRAQTPTAPPCKLRRRAESDRLRRERRRSAPVPSAASHGTLAVALGATRGRKGFPRSQMHVAARLLRVDVDLRLCVPRVAVG